MFESEGSPARAFAGRNRPAVVVGLSVGRWPRLSPGLAMARELRRILSGWPPDCSPAPPFASSADGIRSSPIRGAEGARA